VSGKEAFIYVDEPVELSKAHFLPGAYDEELPRGLLAGIRRYRSEPQVD
jgi:hypothetical protein